MGFTKLLITWGRHIVGLSMAIMDPIRKLRVSKGFIRSPSKVRLLGQQGVLTQFWGRFDPSEHVPRTQRKFREL
jgi:hypothetical protein